MALIMYSVGIVGHFGGGLIDFVATNWIPLGANYWSLYVLQVIIGLSFTGIYFVLFRYLILKFDIPLPGREKKAENIKLYSKKDYKESKQSSNSKKEKNIPTGNEFKDKAYYYLDGLGGKENIKDVTNCATRLRLTVNDENKVSDNDYFLQDRMAHGLVKSGKSIQVIVGLSVPQVREEFESIIQDN